MIARPSYANEPRHAFESTPHAAACEPDARLDLLRRHAAAARHGRRIDIFRACTLIAAEDVRVAEAHADVLMRTLPEALGHQPVFHRPGTPERSFDEAWLMRLIERVEAGDADSATFLAARRVNKVHRRSLLFLISGFTRSQRPARAA